MAEVIVVSGATGTQGGAVADHLLRSGSWQVRALTRDPSKPAAKRLAERGAEVVAADLDDRTSLDSALGGAHGVFSVQNFWEHGYAKEVAQGVALADAAKAAGVRHFVYSSVGSAHRQTGLAHFESKWEIENHVRASGLPYTIVRPVFYMQNFEAPMLADPVLGGTLVQPLSPDRNFQMVDVDDLGGIVALAFANRGEWLGRELDVASDELTMAEIAQTFAGVIGRPVEYVQAPWDAFLEAAGQEYYDMYRWFEDVGYDVDIRELRGLYPALTRLEEYLRRAGWAGRKPAPAGG